ncbi:MAG: fasciclin domain-containing protein [Cyanobacteria bacterium P01_G01_bin.38]
MATIIDITVNSGSFSVLVAALKATGLAGTLQGAGPFTVFAPTDAAFAKLPAGIVDELLKDIPKLNRFLKYHVIPGNVMATDAMKRKLARAADDPNVKMSDPDGVNGKGTAVKSKDVVADNGVIHIIDTVLIPV